MNKEIENLIKKSFAKDIEIKMLDRESDGLIISKEEVREILKELTDVEAHHIEDINDDDYQNDVENNL